jgi:DNA-binding FrmR family transcriptional regulator
VNAREKGEIGARLKRIAGQVTGIERMLQENRAVPDVITQVSAARAALASVSSMLLARHVEDSTSRALETDSARERRDLIDQLVRLFDKRDGG